MINNYNANNITHLDYFDHIRQYPGMYIGSKDGDGLHHLVKEIIANSVDEYLNGQCNKITISLLPNNGISIVDNGRGIPHGEFEPGMSVLQACFGKENTGGKFNNATGSSGYNTSGGEHGTGGKCVNALSTKLIVCSTRDGESETIEFSRGRFISRKVAKADKNLHGQSVIFYPDSKIFETVIFDYNRIKEMIREESFLSSGLTFELEQDGKKETFYSDQGLTDFIDYLAGSNKLITDPIFYHQKEGNFDAEVIFGYTSSYSSNVKLFTNNIPQLKGTHLTGFRTALTATFNQFAREKKWLKDKDENLSGSDLTEGQILVINFKMIDPVFKGQNKEELSSSEGRTYMQKFTKEGLEEYFRNNESDIKVIFDKAISARKAREAAKKARDLARKPKTKGLKAKMELSDKFVDCKSKNPSERNLLLVEGLSAGGSVLESRNVNTDCIYMLRGKILSVLKCDTKKVFENQELSDIIKVIGAGFGDSFDINKMNFDKIVVTSDMDSDGFAIELLLITFFFTYMRPLVEQGKLYRAVTPLYIITTKNEKVYCYSEEELTAWKQSHNEAYDLVHCKGLGEVSASVLKEICFDNQRYKRITVSDGERAKKLLDILEGPVVAPRKQYIYDNAEKLGFNFV